MATKKKTEVAKVEETSTAVAQAPAFMSEGRAGKENLDQKDIELPWLKLLQGTTPGLHENGWKPGNFLHSILEEEVTGNDDIADGDFTPFQITPILAMKAQYRLFNPLEAGGGILARAEDGVHWTPANQEFEVQLDKNTKVKWKTADTVAKSGLDQWGSSNPADPNSSPAADLQYRYICVSPSHPHFGPFMIVLRRSGIKAAKRLNAFIASSSYNCYGLVFDVTSVWESKGPTDKKFLWKFKSAGFVPSEEEYRRNEQAYEQFKEADIGVHDEETMATADIGSDVDAEGEASSDSDEY